MIDGRKIPVSRARQPSDELLSCGPNPRIRVLINRRDSPGAPTYELKIVAAGSVKASVRPDRLLRS